MPNPGSNRFTPYPVIGIRPVIDPRRDIYESTYEQIYSMAERVKDFLTSSLTYSDGTPVLCLVNKTCISNSLEARQCREYFEENNVGALISVASGWCYPLETLDEDTGIPQAMWGFNGTERPGAVYLAAAVSAANMIGLPLFRIYGRDVQDKDFSEIPEDVAKQLLQFAKCAIAVATLKGKSYLSLGTVSMGIASSFIDRNFFSNYLGMRVAYVDMTELDRRIQQGIYAPEEYEKGMRWIREKFRIGSDENPDKVKRSERQKESDWEISLKMALVVRDMMVGNPALQSKFPEESAGYDAIAAGFQGQRAWTNYRPSGDFMEAVLNSGFDWNGPRPPYIVATENDGMNAVSMLFGNLLTHCPQVFCDIRTYWSPDAVERVSGYRLEGKAAGGMIHLLNSGAAAMEGTGAMADANGNPAIKPFWEASEEDREACLRETTWYPDLLDQFFGGGYSSGFSTRGGMPVTMVRLNMVYGIGPSLQLAEGFTVELPEEVHQTLLARTNPTWPSTWFAPASRTGAPYQGVYSLMDAWGANHCSLCYGHIGAELITLASMLRIPVSLHNVPVEQIMRPALWDAYGLRDREAADRAVCEKLGSLY